MINNMFAVIYHLYQTIFLLCNYNFMKTCDYLSVIKIPISKYLVKIL